MDRRRDLGDHRGVICQSRGASESRRSPGVLATLATLAARIPRTPSLHPSRGRAKPDPLAGGLRQRRLRRLLSPPDPLTSSVVSRSGKARPARRGASSTPPAAAAQPPGPPHFIRLARGGVSGPHRGPERWWSGSAGPPTDRIRAARRGFPQSSRAGKAGRARRGFSQRSPCGLAVQPPDPLSLARRAGVSGPPCGPERRRSGSAGRRLMKRTRSAGGWAAVAAQPPDPHATLALPAR
jgi:hypothetical protein